MFSSNDRWEQLSANILQIENEYYPTIRPKQITGATEKSIHALKQRGVKYVELRSLDVNAFDPLGISLPQMRFLEAFLVYCLLLDSPPIDAQERREIDVNELAAAHRGRDPKLYLHRRGSTIKLSQWAGEILDDMTGVCELLDDTHTSEVYRSSLAVQRGKVRDPERTPSARMLAEMRANGEGFFHFGMRMSQQHRDHFYSLSLSPEQQAEFVHIAEQSRQQQQAIEDADDKSFGEFLYEYLAQTL